MGARRIANAAAIALLLLWAYVLRAMGLPSPAASRLRWWRGCRRTARCPLRKQGDDGDSGDARAARGHRGRIAAARNAVARAAASAATAAVPSCGTLLVMWSHACQHPRRQHVRATSPSARSRAAPCRWACGCPTCSSPRPASSSPLARRRRRRRAGAQRAACAACCPSTGCRAGVRRAMVLGRSAPHRSRSRPRVAPASRRDGAGRVPATTRARMAGAAGRGCGTAGLRGLRFARGVRVAAA